jgi:tRNA nucleotidyltransferase (CCA-adding enzyme)
MKIYNVGGSVRDKILGLEVNDFDYLVIGSTPEEMIKLGFQQVGKDFPVFLDKTGDEYALARTDTKNGIGYAGFSCSFGPDVSIEDDLMRRDFTMNAIAEDNNGNITDPYNGVSDIKNKKIKHVSLAFKEDPLRVLRAARFMSRLSSIGFTIDESTMSMMKDMSLSGELGNLKPERVWKEMSRSIVESNPFQFLKTLDDCDAMESVFPEIYGYYKKNQSGISFGLDNISLLTKDYDIVMTSILFSLLKNEELATSYHVVDNFCDKFKLSSELRYLSRKTFELQEGFINILKMSPSKVFEFISSLDGIRKPERISNFVSVINSNKKTDPEDAIKRDLLEKIVNKLINVSSKDFISKGYSGKSLGEAIKSERIRVIDSLMLSESVDNNMSYDS